PQQLQEYQDKQADILDALSAGILAGIKKKDIAKASLQQKVSSMGVLIDKSRLIRGQSTNNSVSILLARHVHSLEVLPSARPVVIPTALLAFALPLLFAFDSHDYTHLPRVTR